MNKVKRKRELVKCFEDVDASMRTSIISLIDDIVFMESQMEALRKLPFMRVHPEDPSRQELTKASRLYKEFTQSYMNAVRILLGLLYKEEVHEDSPLRTYMKHMETR